MADFELCGVGAGGMVAVVGCIVTGAPIVGDPVLPVARPELLGTVPHAASTATAHKPAETGSHLRSRPLVIRGDLAIPQPTLPGEVIELGPLRLAFPYRKAASPKALPARGGTSRRSA